MKSADDFTAFGPDAEVDRLLKAALQFRPEAVPPPDLAIRAVRLAQEQERVNLEEALRTRLAQWERRKWWQRGISAIAAALVIAILAIGAIRLQNSFATTQDSSSVAVDTTTAQTTGDDAVVTVESLTSTTAASSHAPMVVGGIAFLAAVALLTIGRSIGGQEPQWFMATPRLA